jgi:hypothetical protein
VNCAAQEINMSSGPNVNAGHPEHISNLGSPGYIFPIDVDRPKLSEAILKKHQEELAALDPNPNPNKKVEDWLEKAK